MDRCKGWVSGWDLSRLTMVSLLVKWTSHPSFMELLLFLLACFTDCTTRIRGMLLLVDGLHRK